MVPDIRTYADGEISNLTVTGGCNDVGRYFKNLGLASLGAMLEYYDFVVYIYLASKIGAAFFPAGSSELMRTAQTFGIYSIGFIIRPVAGLVIAHYADKLGRKRFFVLTVALMSASTLLMGLLPTYAVIGWAAPALLLLLRVLQGCAVGGELPSAAVFVSEHSRPDRIGFSGGFLQAAAYGGFLLGVTAAMAADSIASHFPHLPSLSWRLPFIVGGAFGLISGLLRRSLEESPMFVEMKARGDAVEAAPSRTVLRDHFKACTFGFGLIFAMTVTNVVYFQYWPTLLESQLHYSHTQALAVSLTAIVCVIISMPIWGFLSDRFGLTSTMGSGVVFLALASGWLFSDLSLMERDTSTLIWAMVPVAIGSGAVVGAVPGLLSSIFPTSVRQTGYAVPYNIGVALFGGPLPLLLVLLTSAFGLISPLYILFLSYAVFAICVLVLPKMTFFLGKVAEKKQSP